MKENHVQFPNKRLTVTPVICDRDFVAVHSHIALSPDETGGAAGDLFRFTSGQEC